MGGSIQGRRSRWCQWSWKQDGNVVSSRHLFALTLHQQGIYQPLSFSGRLPQPCRPSMWELEPCTNRTDLPLVLRNRETISDLAVIPLHKRHLTGLVINLIVCYCSHLNLVHSIMPISLWWGNLRFFSPQRKKSKTTLHVWMERRMGTGTFTTGLLTCSLTKCLTRAMSIRSIPY